MSGNAGVFPDMRRALRAASAAEPARDGKPARANVIARRCAGRGDPTWGAMTRR
jgi:hypothetical protein